MCLSIDIILFNQMFNITSYAHFNLYTNISLSDYINYGMLPILCNLLMFWVMSTIFIYIDHICEQKKLLSIYKIQGKSLERKGGYDWKMYKDTAIYVFLNQILITIPVTIISVPLLKMSIHNITPYYLVPLQIFGLVIIEDILFYTFHRMLHIKFIYKHIHSMHHKWNAPVALSSQYSHPIEQLFANILPIAIAGSICILNFIGFNIWTNIASLNALLVHSDYKLYGMADTHDLHHKYRNCYYGSSGFCDYILGTESKKLSII